MSIDELCTSKLFPGHRTLVGPLGYTGCVRPRSFAAIHEDSFEFVAKSRRADRPECQSPLYRGHDVRLRYLRVHGMPRGGGGGGVGVGVSIEESYPECMDHGDMVANWRKAGLRHVSATRSLEGVM